MEFINPRVIEKDAGVTVEAGITGNAEDMTPYGERSWFFPNFITCDYHRTGDGGWECGKVTLSGPRRLKDGSTATAVNGSFEWLRGGEECPDLGAKGAPAWVQVWVRANTPKS